MARGNYRFVRFYLDELDKSFGGPGIGGTSSANNSIVKNYEEPLVTKLCFNLLGQ